MRYRYCFFFTVEYFGVCLKIHYTLLTEQCGSMQPQGAAVHNFVIQLAFTIVRIVFCMDFVSTTGHFPFVT